MTRLPIIIDTDPGIDDAVALLMALTSPEFDVIGLGVVAGNVSFEHTLANTLNVLELAGRPDVPVYPGCTRPLLREPVYGLFSGAGGLGEAALPEPTLSAASEHAVNFLVRVLGEAAAGRRPKPTLCPIGPLTNIALAIAHSPEIVAGIDRIVLMGGAFAELGNRSISAEFNILVDPHAAQIVMNCGAPIVMLPLDLTHKAIATFGRIEAIRALNNPVAGVVADLLAFWDRKDVDRFQTRGGPLHDPAVFSYLLNPEWFSGREGFVAVETVSELSMGHTVVDWWGQTDQPPNALVLTDLDADAFFDDLCRRLARYGKGAP